MAHELQKRHQLAGRAHKQRGQSLPDVPVLGAKQVARLSALLPQRVHINLVLPSQQGEAQQKLSKPKRQS
jgi:hypothetical protein